MENSSSSHKIKLHIRIVGVCITLLGFIFLLSDLMGSISSSQITLNCALPISLLMIIGGSLLFALRKGALDVIFVVLRFFILFGLIFVVIGLFTQQFIATIPLFTVVAISGGLMLFLSREDVKSVLGKKD